jgi:hypothetical protein
LSEICNDLILAQSMPSGPSTPTLLARSALVVEGDNILGGPCHVRNNEADTRIEFARMPFDLGDAPARLSPASGLIGVICIGTPHFIRRSPNRARQ